MRSLVAAVGASAAAALLLDGSGSFCLAVGGGHSFAMGVGCSLWVSFGLFMLAGLLVWSVFVLRGCLLLVS